MDAVAEPEWPCTSLAFWETEGELGAQSRLAGLGMLLQVPQGCPCGFATLGRWHLRPLCPWRPLTYPGRTRRSLLCGGDLPGEPLPVAAPCILTSATEGPASSGCKDRTACVFQLGTDTESTQATTDIYEKEEAIEIDYSSLRADLKVSERPAPRHRLTTAGPCQGERFSFTKSF